MKKETKTAGPLKSSLSAGQILRRQAEALILEKASLGNIDNMSQAEVMQMFHELQVHQIELEMQNEELRAAQEALEGSRERYIDLYDFAPVGYITLSKEGLILESNLAAAALLGEARSDLIKRRISGFILKEDQDIQYLNLKKFFESGEPLKYELRMVDKAGVQFWSQLTGSVAQYAGAPACRMVISNISEYKLLEDAYAFLLTCSLSTTGEDFFKSLARYLSKTLDMEYVCIDRLTGDDLTAETIAVYNNGKFEMNICYALKDTPCGEVVEKGICCYPKELRRLFPQDAALQKLMAESYLGTILIDSKGKQIGLIAVIGQHELFDSKPVESLLKLVATRAAGELERRQAEEKLLPYKSIVDSSEDMMALIDTHYRYLAVNDTYLNFVDKNRDEIIGHSIAEMFSEKFFRNTITPNAENCMDGYNVRYSTWFEFPTMGRRYMDVEYSPYRNDNKEILGFVVNARDKTDLKKSRILLEQNERQLETVLNNIDLSVYITDLKSNTILFINKHLKQYYDEDLIGKICWKSFYENQNGPCEYCKNEKLTDADKKLTVPCITEIYNQNRNKWYERNDSAIPWTDGTLVHLGIITDITERKKLEEKQKKIKTILEEKVRLRTADLEDMNTALKVLLMKRQEDKDEMEDKIFSNYKLIISPILDNVKKNLSRENDKEMISILDSELKNIISPFSKKLSDQMINLTPTEIHVANLIKLGKTNKEISNMLDSSVHTISRHRENIREKTGLKNTKTNLRSFLLTLG